MAEPLLPQIERRYRAGVRGRAQGWRAWSWLFRASPGLTFSVAALGVVTAGTSLATAVSMTQVAYMLTSGNGEGIRVLTAALAGSLILGAAAETLRQRSELRLGLRIRFLVTREILRSPRTASPTSVDGALLTLPRQIAQLVYVIDACTSALAIVVISVATIQSFGAAGITALILTLAVAVVSTALVHRVGRLWRQHTDLEVLRQGVLADAIRGLPQVCWGRFWSVATTYLDVIRVRQERLYRRRAPLLTLTGICDYSSIAIIAIGVLLLAGPDGLGAGVVLGLLPTIRILWTAVQNNIANYRVIALALPPLRLLDRIRGEVDPAPAGSSPPFPPYRPGNITRAVVPRDLNELFRQDVERKARNTVIVAASDPVPMNFIAEWLNELDPASTAAFEDYLHRLGIGPLLARLSAAPMTARFSHGEGCRIMVAVALAHRPGTILLDGVLAALDGEARLLLSALASSCGEVRWVLAESRESDFPAHSIIHRATRRPDGSLGWRADTVGVASDPTIRSKPATSGASHTNRAANQALSHEADSANGSPGTHVRIPELHRALRTLFARRHLACVVLGAIVLSAVEPALATLTSAGTGAERSGYPAIGATLCALLLGATVHYYSVYRAPNVRLTALHRKVVEALPSQCARRPSGAVLGIAGEDFCSLQMQVPATLGTAILALSELTILGVLMTLATPIAAAASLAIVPGYWFVLRSGESRLRAAAHVASRVRSRFLGPTTELARSTFCRSLATDLHPLYSAIEKRMADAERALIDAQCRRGALVLALHTVLTVAAVTTAGTLASEAGSHVAIAVLLYLGCVVVPRIGSVIGPLQSVSVALLAQGRLHDLIAPAEATGSMRFTPDSALRSLLDWGRTLPHSSPPVFASVAGPSGVGKSQGVGALLMELRRTGRVAEYYPHTAPFVAQWFTEAVARDRQLTPPSGFLTSRSAQQDYLRNLVLNDASPLVVLDETLDDLDDEHQSAWLKEARRRRPPGTMTVIISHSELLSTRCDRSIRLSGNEPPG